MQIVTLTTDWKQSDYYSAAIKGYMLRHVPQAQVVDISHQVQAFYMTEAAFVLRSTYKGFPAGTVHLIGVRSEMRSQASYLVVRQEGQYFIGPDSGIFSLLFDTPPEEIIEIDTEKLEEPYLSFPELTVMAHTAARLLQQARTQDIGRPISAYKRLPGLMPTVERDKIVGKVIYIDSYQNIITNISKTLFGQIEKGRNFAIYVQSKFNRIDQLSSTYSENPQGEMLALFNSAGLLEVAIHFGHIAQMYNLDTDSQVRVDFFNPEDEQLPLRNTL